MDFSDIQIPPGYTLDSYSKFVNSTPERPCKYITVYNENNSPVQLQICANNKKKNFSDSQEEIKGEIFWTSSYSEEDLERLKKVMK